VSGIPERVSGLRRNRCPRSFGIGVRHGPEHAPLLVVRFEDAKTDPYSCALRVLRFIGVERSAKEVEAAVASSSFDSARRAMEAAEQDSRQRFLTARRGRLHEWVETYDETTRALVTGPVTTLMKTLGYGLDPASPLTSLDESAHHFEIQLNKLLLGPASTAAEATIAALSAGSQIPVPKLVEAVRMDTTVEGVTRHEVAALMLADQQVRRIFRRQAPAGEAARRDALATFYCFNTTHMSYPPILRMVRANLRMLKEQKETPDCPPAG